MAASKIIIKKKKNRKLIFAFQYSKSNKILSYDFSYDSIFKSFIIFVLFTVSFPFYLLMQQESDLYSFESNINRGLTNVPVYEDSSIEKDMVVAQSIQIIKKIDKLLMLQREIRNEIRGTDRGGSAERERVESVAFLKKDFVMQKVSGARLQQDLPIIECNKKYMDFYEEVLYPIPHRSPLLDKSFINSPYGYRKKPGNYNSITEFHRGIDLKARSGSSVVSTASGKVKSAGYNVNGYGRWVLLEHVSGYKTLYAHLSDIVVTGGQYVRVGEVIGYSGNSGHSTGPHLHYEIRKGRKKIDPLTMFVP